ncbi:hypothetical protein C8R45DRAFT_947516 [Mycena sanguinolenta]|nr:hypothetical protein C8R45DRAFT_947516 [Mycena sanguinolenta]
MALLSKAIAKRKGQLENWFHNQSKKVGNANSTVVTGSSNAMLKQMFRTNEPRKRTHHRIELFQKRNPELVTAALKAASYDLLNQGSEPDDDEDDWTDQTQDTPAARTKRTKSLRMRLRTHIVRNLFNDASEEELEEITREIEQEKKDMREEQLLAKQNKKLQSKTPMERQNDLTLKVVCFGDTPNGNDFLRRVAKTSTTMLSETVFQCVPILHVKIDNNPQHTGDEDTSTLALPTTLNSMTDDIPVHRIATAEPVAEPEKIKKSKSKKAKSKTKQNELKTKESTSIDTTAVEDPGMITETNESVCFDASQPSSHCVSPVGAEMDFWGHNEGSHSPQDSEVFDDQNPVPAVDVAPEFVPSPWIAGMTALLAPEVTAAIARIEGGGGANSPTMAIDPRFVNLSLTSAFMLVPLTAPQPVSTSTLPKPKPAWKGSASAPTTDTFRLPPNLSRPSPLFKVFHRPKTPQTQPTVPPLTLRAVSATTPPSKSSLLSSKPTTSSAASSSLPKTTMAAQLVTGIINSHVATTTPSNPSTAPPVAPAPPPAHPIVPPALGLTWSTNPTRLSPSRTAAAGSQGAWDERDSQKWASQKADAAAEAKKAASLQDGLKKRGRPQKEPLTDITNEVVSMTDTLTDVAAPPTTMPDAGSASSSSEPNLIYSIINNNHVAARQAAEREKAEAVKVAADAVATQAGKGWTETMVNGATVVIFTSTRVCKAAKHPDGSEHEKDGCVADEAVGVRSQEEGTVVWGKKVRVQWVREQAQSQPGSSNSDKCELCAWQRWGAAWKRRTTKWWKRYERFQRRALLGVKERGSGWSSRFLIAIDDEPGTEPP